MSSTFGAGYAFCARPWQRHPRKAVPAQFNPRCNALVRSFQLQVPLDEGNEFLQGTLGFLIARWQ